MHITQGRPSHPRETRVTNFLGHQIVLGTPSVLGTHRILVISSEGSNLSGCTGWPLGSSEAWRSWIHETLVKFTSFHGVQAKYIPWNVRPKIGKKRKKSSWWSSWIFLKFELIRHLRMTQNVWKFGEPRCHITWVILYTRMLDRRTDGRTDGQNAQASATP